MSFETYNHTLEISQIKSIEFCVFGNTEVKRYSVINEQAGIVIPEASENGEPKQGGLIDKRLGVTDYNMVCDTCGLLSGECPGHFGHIELAQEVYHYLYLDITKNTANCICLYCSKLLIGKNKDNIVDMIGNSYKKTRFAKIRIYTSNVKFCQNCGKPVGKISKKISKTGNIQLIVTYNIDIKQEDSNNNTNVSTMNKKKNIEVLTPSRLYSIFKNIDDNDCQLMGFDPSKNRPESFIIKYFPIPPVAIRPSVRLEMLSSGPSEDSLTSKLADIVKDNERLKKQNNKTFITGEESKYNQDYLQLLQFDIATYFDNDSILPKSEQKGSKASKSISERLKGKTGRIRGNLMGKRVDFSARTVITSDPNLDLDELGVPIKIAMNITFPEEVTPFNIDRLTKIVRNGRDVYPGANFVLPYHRLESGKKTKIDLRYRKKSIKLHLGDIVERHIIDGDPVIFNRQPSLHKMSMMCHRIRVIKDELLNTFRLNVTVTTPYNADFDGDEMNMFIPQSVQTQLEIANIADVPRQIISPRYSRPIIKFKQDTVLGTFKMTEMSKKVSYNDAMNLAMYCKNIDIFKIEKEDIDTHKLYSLIIPNLINFTDGKVNITNGKLLTGTMGDNILNQRIVYYSWDRHGSTITKNFFDNAQRLVTNWLLINGFSVGLGDATTNKSVVDDINAYCEIKQMEVDKLITEMENNPETLDPDTFESNILSTLKASDGEITKKTYDHLKNNESYNNFYVMVESKAKGSQGNIGQIIGGLGQNVLEFKRIKKKVNNRTLPHFFQNDDRAFARGFIPNSYYHGLTPKEFFFHHMTAREGMIDTAIKSVIGDTPIIILDNNIIKYVKIGEWIDTLLNKYKNGGYGQIQIDKKNNEHREMLQISDNIYIPTTDLDGNVNWGQITHITRHNPSTIMYEIKTESGRHVIVTDSHSLLIWNNNMRKFERKSASTINIGDFVPVTAQLKYNGEFELHECNFVNPFNTIEDRDIGILNANANGIYVEIDQTNPLKLNKVNVNKYNDVILDAIIEINLIDGSKYDKVYDLTIPSTLNFCLANGLHVVDTADSGYLQRKLIKGMEDIMIAYDKTVRSGNNVIIQYIYGDNNINQTYYKEVDIKLVNMSNTDINKIFSFTKDELKNIAIEFKLDNSKLTNWNKETIEYMKFLRDDLRNIQMKARMNYITMLDKYQLPINITRIIEDAKNTLSSLNNERLNPLYVNHAITYILKPEITKINLLPKNYSLDSIKYKDQNTSKYLFKIALLEYLSPKRCIFEYRLSKPQFDVMIIEVIKSFRKACVEPGEMVGVLTAQSLGETLTQMSIIGNTKILIKQESKRLGVSYINCMTIAELIDNIYSLYTPYIVDIPNHLNSTEFNLDNLPNNYYICGVEQSENVKWNKISHFSRHPTNGNLLKIKTLSGRTITSTKSHNFLKRTKNGIIAVTSENLMIKDRLPVAKHINYQANNDKLMLNNYELELTNSNGILIGIYLANDNINYNYDDVNCLDDNLVNILPTYCNTDSSNKKIPEFVHNANINFVKGLLQGYYDTKGTISLEEYTINTKSESKQLIDDISIFLSYFGIFSSKKVVEELFCLDISHNYAQLFLDNIGSNVNSKYDDLNKIIDFSNSNYQYESDTTDIIPEIGHIIVQIKIILELNDLTIYDMDIDRQLLPTYIKMFKTRAIEINKLDDITEYIEYLNMIYNGDVIWDEIVEIIEIADTKEFVYDFTIPNNETFMVYDGIVIHNTLNTFHSTGVGVKGMQGIPRFREILSYTKKIQTPFMIIKLIPEVRSDQIVAHKIEAYLKHTVIGNLLDNMNIIFDSIPEALLTSDNINTKNIYYIGGSNTDIENLPWLFRCVISREAMLENDITLLDIKTKFIKYWDDYANDSVTNKKKSILSRVTNGCIMSNFDNSDVPVIHIRFDVFNPDNYTLVEIGQFICNKISIKGVETIEKVDRVDKQKVIEYDEDQGIKSNSTEWVIYTTGIDLHKIKTIKYIDFNSVYLNDIYKTYIIFGIEAARNLILKETDNLYNGSGNPLNIAHLALLADIKTNTGTITSIDRHGINRLDTDPLSRASFENTVEHLITAAAFNEIDHMRSVSSRIMVGRCINGGTGSFSIMLDDALIENSEQSNQSKSYISSSTRGLEENDLMKDSIIRENIDIFMP